MKERTGNIRVFAAAAALAVAAAAFCGTALASDKEEGTEGTHIVTDHNGNEVAVPDNAERIVVCDIYPLPSVLTVFFDSADKIVGMAQPSMTAAQNGLLGELYPELLDAQTGFIDGSDINMEELLKLEPDVVFYSASNPAQGPNSWRARSSSRITPCNS